MSFSIRIENLSKKYILRHGASTGSLKELVEHTRIQFFKKINPLNSLKKDPFEITSEEFWALKDISFEVPKGAKLGIMGRNGAGKSTLLKILSHITEPTSGRVLINGNVSSILEVGTGFHPELSGRENVFLNGAIMGMSRSETKSKFDEIVGFSEVEKFIDTPFKYYSSGMKVRLAFSVSAHLDPDILILDEVMAVGDIAFQKKCLDKMDEISNSGATVVFVNHGVDAIKQYCNRVIFLEGGKLILDTNNIDEAIILYLGKEKEWYREKSAVQASILS